MGIFVLTDAVTWLHDLDLTGYSNKISVKPSVTVKDSTVFGLGGWRRHAGGLKAFDLASAGLWDAPVDAAGFTALGVSDRVVTMSAPGSEGSVAYFGQAGTFAYEAFDAVGELIPYTLDVKGTNTAGLVRGRVARARGSVAATGPLGSAVNAGAGGAGKWLYAALHIFGTPGTTITVQVQSDDAQAFASPTTRATIGTLTAAGGVFMTRVDAAAITDAWWRFNVSAITGTFDVAGSIGIQ